MADDRPGVPEDHVAGVELLRRVAAGRCIGCGALPVVQAPYLCETCTRTLHDRQAAAAGSSPASRRKASRRQA